MNAGNALFKPSRSNDKEGLVIWSTGNHSLPTKVIRAFTTGSHNILSAHEDKLAKIKSSFEAVAVLLQYDFENGARLFEV